MKKKDFIIIIIFIILTLIIFKLFPVKNDFFTFQQTITLITFFIIIPILFNKFFLKRNLGDIGIQMGDWKQGLIWSGIGLFVVGLGFLIAIYFFDFLKQYPILKWATVNYKNFLFYEVVLVAPIIFIYDFFFRGFIISALKSRLFYWTIIVQAALFLLLTIATNSFSWALFPYLLSAPLAGVIVYKSGSIFYATVFQFITIIILDANIIRLIK